MKLRIASMMVLVLLAAGCSRRGNLEAGGIYTIRSACPQVAIPAATGDITLFDPAGSSDASAIDIEAAITNVRANCQETGSEIVSVATFDWHSIRPSTLRRMPLSETVVMLITVAATVWTHNLAIGVTLGVLSAMVLFARRVAHFTTVTRTVDGDVARYRVDGELFFASSNDLTTQFEYAADPARVVIDLSRTHVWDASTVAALDAIVTKYEQRGTSVELEGMSEAAAKFHGRLSGGLGSAG